MFFCDFSGIPKLINLVFFLDTQQYLLNDNTEHLVFSGQGG